MKPIMVTRLETLIAKVRGREENSGRRLAKATFQSANFVNSAIVRRLMSSTRPHFKFPSARGMGAYKLST